LIIIFISLPNFFFNISSNSLIFSQFLPIKTPTFEVKIMISHSLAVFLIITFEIPDLPKVSSTNFLILISSTKKSAPVLLCLANHSEGRDFIIHTLIPIGLAFDHIICFT